MKKNKKLGCYAMQWQHCTLGWQVLPSAQDFPRAYKSRDKGSASKQRSTPLGSDKSHQKWRIRHYYCLETLKGTLKRCWNELTIQVNYTNKAKKSLTLGCNLSINVGRFQAPWHQASKYIWIVISMVERGFSRGRDWYAACGG